MILRSPVEPDRAAIEDMVSDFESHNSAYDGAFWEKGSFDFDVWLDECRRAQTEPVKEGFVCAQQFVSFDETGTALGFLNLRLELNDYLREPGGHIGYSIRPTQRGRGYAKEQLRLGLQKAYEADINPVLITCHNTTPASRATILSQGGVLEDVRRGVERYWLSLE